MLDEETVGNAIAFGGMGVVSVGIWQALGTAAGLIAAGLVVVLFGCAILADADND